jgi:hypothetical protein
MAVYSKFAGGKMCYIKNCQKCRVYEGFKKFLAKKRLIIAVPAKGNLKGVSE